MNVNSNILQTYFQELTIDLQRVNLLRCDSNWKGDHTVPPYSSIGLIRKGTGTMIVNDVVMHPSAGQLYLLPAKSTQTFFTDETAPYEKFFCHFNIGSRGAELFDFIQMPFCVDARDVEKASSLFQSMIHAASYPDLTSFIQVKQCMLNLLSYYLECCPADSISLIETSFDASIRDAVSYVEANLHNSVSVPAMAAVAGYHPGHFSKRFQKQLGITPAQFIIRKKTESAIEQLTTTTRSIAEIAESLSFSSQFYFCSFFKKQTGMTPSEYRHIYFRNPF